MLGFFAEDIHLRRDVLEKHPAAGATIRTHIVREGVVYDDGKVKVTAFAVDHRPVVTRSAIASNPAARSIVISGDTRPTREPRALRQRRRRARARSATSPNTSISVDTPAVAARLKSYHTSAEEAGQLAARAGVKTLVLTHLIPGNADETFRERAGREFQGEVVVGRDLMRIGVK